MIRAAAGFRFLICLAASLLASTSTALAGTISLNTWYQFSFGTAGTPAAGCAPDDPGGAFCISSSGTPTSFLDAPPWTFTAPSGGVFITVVDAFTTGERFQLFDGGLSVGLTSAPNPNGDCGDDPAVCLLDPNASKGTFFVAAGARSLTIAPTLSPDDAGSAYFIVESVPEPSTWALVAVGLAAAVASRRKDQARKDEA